ncbi:MAG TPA: hypothetical protein VG826_12545 [Pirellulales bacterium]|nr:hypothetical protein [Pirellulales bacterium]
MRQSPFRATFLVTLLIFAALNAASYFVRSGDALLGRTHGVGRIGFPWLVWHEGSEPNRGFATVALGPDGDFDYGALALNAALGLAASFVVGLLATLVFNPKASSKLLGEEKLARIEVGGPPQFSLRSLLLATAAVAAALAFLRPATHEARVFYLAAIYLLGPSLLVGCVWAARARKRAEQTLVAFAALATLVAVALVVGTGTEQGDFTRVLLGLYVYWVPQCVALLAVCSARQGWKA